MSENLKLLGIAIASIAIAAFVYAAYIANPPLIQVSDFGEWLNKTIEQEQVKNQKLDPVLQQQLAVNPKKPVRMFVSGVNATELERQGFKVVKAGKYANWAVVEGDYEELQKLLENPRVQKVIYDQRVRAIGFADTLSRIPIKPVVQDLGWNLEAIKADIAHRSNFTGSGAVVAILDTGVNHNLPDLDDGYLGGYDFAYGDAEPDDIYGHGTECASIILAEGEDRYTGVAPQAKYYALKVLNDNGEGNWSDVIAGLEWVLDRVNAGERVDIVSMSLGADLAPPELETLCDLLYSKGVILVAASGNSGSVTSLYPAAYDTVISVAATDIYGSVAAFSNGGALVAAPGVQVPVLSSDGNLYYGDGTSYAAPHVAGVLLLVEAEKDITPGQAETLIKLSTDEISDPNSKVEYGQINAVKAINNALNLNLSEERSWYEYLNEPWAQVLVGLAVLAGALKFVVWRQEGGE